MIRNRKVMTAALVVEMTIGLLVMAGSVQADPTFINTCPAVISSPGRYLLAADVFCPSGGGGITISSSHVTLALEGHIIIPAGGTNSGSAISNSGTPVTDVHILGPGLITGNVVNAFLFGVVLGGVTDSEVSGITVRGARTAGINASGQGLRLTKNTLAGGVIGIVVGNITSSTISENDASGNFVGIQINNGGVTGGPPIIFSRNIVNGNTNTGLDIDTGFVTAQNNVVSGNGTVGINVTASQLGHTIALEIIHNTALANGTLDLNDAVPNCAGSVWADNTFFAANPSSCIH